MGNPFEDYNPIFTYYKSSEPIVTSVEDPLFGKLNVEDGFRINPQTGNYIAQANTPKNEEFQTDYLNRMAETHSEPTAEIDTSSNNKNLEGGSLIANEKFAYEYLVKNKIPKGTAAGIVGNLYHEDLANPTRTVKDSHGTKAYGVAGFNTKGEYPALMAWAKKKGIEGNPSFQQQLDFIIDIIKERPNLNILLNSSLTPTEASFIWGSQFERFAGDNGKGYLNRNDSHHKRRAARANKIFKTYG